MVTYVLLMAVNCYFFPLAALSGLLLLAPTPVLAQAPTLTALTPASNARAVPRNASVVATFSQPLTAASATALKVFSSQRGGLRGGGTATVAGNRLSFAPTAYDFRPGETVQYTLTTGAASSGGNLAAAQVGRFTAAAGAGTGLFAGGSDLVLSTTSFNTTHGVALGDVDGDGDLDIAAANDNRSNTANSTVSIALNGGRGTFGPGQNVPVNGRPFAVVLGDVDGDGDLDLLTANNRDPGTVSVRLNNGTGTFSGTQDVAVDRFAHSLALGDVDGDGDLDLVTANNFGMPLSGPAATASVRLNNGAGVFGGTQNVVVGMGARSVMLGDLDNDGDLDFATANSYANTVSICLNNGSGTFASTQSVAVGREPYGLALGDVDGDGDLDLATANYANIGLGTASVRLNSGAATFGGAQEVTLNGSGPVMVVLGDVDGDADLDLLTADGNTFNTVSVRLNGGTGTFGGSQSVPLAAGALPYDLALGDVDGDGDLDFVAANYYILGVSVRLNGGSGPLATAPGSAPAALTAAPNPATGRVALTLPPAATTAELLDALGRPVRRVPATAGTATLDVTGLPVGLYLVRAAGQVARLLVE